MTSHKANFVVSCDRHVIVVFCCHICITTVSWATQCSGIWTTLNVCTAFIFSICVHMSCMYFGINFFTLHVCFYYDYCIGHMELHRCVCVHMSCIYFDMIQFDINIIIITLMV